MPTVYLDTNHWISLARAASGHPTDPGHVRILELLRHHVAAGELQLPLSWIHYIEVHQAHQVERRRRLARLMIELSQGLSIAPLSLRLPESLTQSVARAFGIVRVPQPAAVLGRGVAFAFGQPRMSLFDGTALFMEPILAGTQDGLGDAELALAAEVLTSLRAGSSSRAREFEAGRAWARRDSPDALFRLHLARTAIQVRPAILDALYANAVTLDLSSPTAETTLTAIILGVPELAVSVRLNVARDLQHDRRVAGNDFRDIDALCLAIPCCDLVVTEALWTSLSNRRASAVPHGDRVVRSLESLEHFLAQRAGGRAQ